MAFRLRIGFFRAAAMSAARSTALLALFIVSFPVRAQAQTPGQTLGQRLPVLAIESEDAEDQAEALTSALRGRVRNAKGWQSSDAAHSLGALTAAFRCPQKPDMPCLTRIADQLKADHFLWGVLARTVNRQVLAEVHLFSRGKPETVARETYSDNLLDPNDDGLQKIAAHIFERLTGISSTGIVRVRAGTYNGLLVVDGAPYGPVQNGSASAEVTAGTHEIELRVKGFTPARTTVQVQAGGEALAILQLIPEVSEDEPRDKDNSTPGRRYFAYGALAAGAGFLAAGTIQGVRFLSLRSDNQRDSESVSGGRFCSNSDAAARNACGTYEDAKTARTLEIVFLGLGSALAATGAILMLTEAPSSQPARPANRKDPRAAPPRARVHLFPEFSPLGGSLRARVSF